MPQRRTQLVLATTLGLLIGVACGLAGTAAIVLVRIAHVVVRLSH